jgi:flagellin FlaB
MPKYTDRMKHRKGITGLETAIILIAFVIVASVLSYVVISAGLFSSQKAKAAVNSGLAQTGNTIELKGNVTAELGFDVATSLITLVNKVYLTVGVVPGGSAVDLSPNPTPVDGVTTNPKLVVSYSDASQQVPSLYWTVDFINTNNGDNMLDPGELALVTIFLDNSADYYTDNTDVIHYMPDAVVPGTTFSLSLTPPDGSILPIERLLPAGVGIKDGEISALVNLY